MPSLLRLTTAAVLACAALFLGGCGNGGEVAKARTLAKSDSAKPARPGEGTGRTITLHVAGMAKRLGLY